MNHISRSPGCRSQLRPWFLKCSTTIPPWPCTIALGRPVVPEENSTHSGWSNGTCANSSGARSASSALPADSRVRQRVLGARRGRARGRRARASAAPARISATSARAVDRPLAVAVAGHREQHLRLELRRSGRARCAGRTPAGTRPRSRRGWRWPGTRRASRGCSAGRRRRGRPAPTPSRCRPARAAATCSRSSREGQSITARASASARSTATRSSRPPAAQRVLGVVQARPREPPRARHLARGQHRARSGVRRANAEELPQRAPERPRGR